MTGKHPPGAKARRSSAAGPGPDRRLRLAFLRFCKLAGLFAACRLLTRKRLRILCYHGFSSADECAFRPQLFIEPGTFRGRMAHLAAAGYPVLGLGEALERLGRGELDGCPAVITVDDGFHNFRALALEILAAHRFPSTVYVTTYYVERPNPVFRLAVQYLFWKASAAGKDAARLLPAVEGLPASASAGGMWGFIRHGEKECTEARRLELIRSLGAALGVDPDPLFEERILSLMTPAEIREIAAAGVDVQLHTHRHTLALDEAEVAREIEENRACLASMAPGPLAHFCYPSGVWSDRHWAALGRAGVVSATTCEPGFNGPRTPRLGLRRFLDSEAIDPIEFEAEMSGMLEVLRTITGRTRRTDRKRDSGTDHAYPGI